MQSIKLLLILCLITSVHRFVFNATCAQRDRSIDMVAAGGNDALIQFAVITFVFRPPDIVVGGLMFYQRFFLSFFRRLISELAERNLTKIGYILRSKCNLKTHVQNQGYSPYKSGAQKPPFFEDFAT